MNWTRIVILTLLTGILIFLSFNQHHHSRKGYFNYQSEIWADRAGYHVYLPATFIYGFDANEFPDSMDVRTGLGFHLDPETGVVSTKYTYGVALLQAPFFLGAHIYSKITGKVASGYGPAYHGAVNIAGVFYVIMGLLLLYKFLLFRYNPTISFITVAVIFLGTNIFHYAVYDTGMSHIYSFFLFSAFLYVIRKTKFLQRDRISDVVVFGLISSLILLIRPTGLMFLAIFFFLDWINFKEFYKRLFAVLKWQHLIILLVCLLVVWLPQILYYKYTTGHFFSYTYGDEKFHFLLPNLHFTWFSPNNGLFLYNPLYAVILVGFILMIRKKVMNGWVAGVLFFLISYVFACWWDWSFGCSFGARSFVEYASLFSLPIAFILSKFRNFHAITKVMVSVILIACIYINLKLFFAFDMCYFGEGFWDWEWYKVLLLSNK